MIQLLITSLCCRCTFFFLSSCSFILHGPSWTAQRTSWIVVRAVSAYSSSGAPGSGTNYARPSRAMFARCFAYAFLNPSRVLSFYMSPGTLFQSSVTLTEKKCRLMSNRPCFTVTFRGSAAVLVTLAAWAAITNQSAGSTSSFLVRIL